MGEKHKIYVASSWRNKRQPFIVELLRALGHEVYDFRHPKKGNNGFRWSGIDKGWAQWTAEEYISGLDHPLARQGYFADFEAMCWADTFVLVEPCGKSAYLEFGWAVGSNKTTIALIDDSMEPELMLKMAAYIFGKLEDFVKLFI